MHTLFCLIQCSGCRPVSSRPSRRVARAEVVIAVSLFKGTFKCVRLVPATHLTVGPSITRKGYMRIFESNFYSMMVLAVSGFYFNIEASGLRTSFGILMDRAVAM